MRDPRAAVDETGAPPHWETVVRGEHVRIKHFTSRVYRPDDLDLTVRAGELLVITGPTGCGKSSLALSLDGLIPHVVEADLEGTVTVLGADVTSTRVADLARDVGMVLQDPDTQIVTTQLLDEVCFGLENLQVPADQVEPRALEALTVVGLDARANDRPHDLSGGQRQRLVLACALAMQPKLLVLDEPTSHIDPRSAAELLSLLPRLRDEGMTIVIVEHNLDHIIDHADRLLVLDQFGRALAEGDPLATINEHWGQLCAVGVRLPTAFQVRQALAGSEAASPQQPREVEVTLDHTVPDTDIDTAARQYPPAATEADPEEVIVRAEHLRIVRGRRLVVPDLSMSLRRGEFTALIGPNGAGKTTVGLALAGLIRSRGTLQVAGRDPRKLSMRSLSDLVGYVFQNPEHQFVTHTVVDEIAHGLRLRKHPESDVMERVETLLERLGLEGVRERHPFMLSGGAEAAVVRGDRTRHPTTAADPRRTELRSRPGRDRIADGSPGRGCPRGNVGRHHHPRSVASSGHR